VPILQRRPAADDERESKLQLRVFFFEFAETGVQQDTFAWVALTEIGVTVTKNHGSLSFTIALPTERLYYKNIPVLLTCQSCKRIFINFSFLNETHVQKEQANVVSAHQHHVSISRDPFNRYVAIDSGGLFDQRRMLYASRTDSTAPVMANGDELGIVGVAR
jgi:hypothetical protein